MCPTSPPSPVSNGPQKAVNTPINAISPVSTAHLRDKLDKLRQLLRGQPVAVTGGQVSAASHPHGVAFCLDLVAKKFVVSVACGGAFAALSGVKG